MDLVAVFAMIQAVAIAIKAVCDVLLSGEGQLTMKVWREDGQAFRDAMKGAGSWLSGVIKDLRGKESPVTGSKEPVAA
jgi:hypothetical protein